MERQSVFDRLGPLKTSENQGTPNHQGTQQRQPRSTQKGVRDSHPGGGKPSSDKQQRGTPGPPPPRRRSPEAAAAAQLQRTLADVHNDRHPKYVDIVVKGTKEDSEERRAAAAAAHLQAQLVRLEQERAAAQELADALLQSQQALMQEKQRVQQENSALQREQAALRERLDYLQELHCGDGGGGHAPAGSPGGDGFYSPRHFGVDGHGGELPITPDSTVLRQIQQQLEGEEDGGPGGGRPPLEDGPPLEDVVARLQLED